MLDDSYSLRTEIINVDAAVVGIRRSRWEAIDAAIATEDHAREFMSARRFDVVPIVTGEAVHECFVTEQWNHYSSVSRRDITHRDVIPLHTGIREVIKGFAAEDRLFYFLSGGSQISGLISVANLNSRPMKVYLFGLLSELELGLGELISSSNTEEEVITLASDGGKSAPCDNPRDDARERYEADRAKGVDASFMEYLSLMQLVKIVRKGKLYQDLGYASGKSFGSVFEPLADLRNAVAHPVRSIVTSTDSIPSLWRRIDYIEEGLFRLSRWAAGRGSS